MIKAIVLAMSIAMASGVAQGVLPRAVTMQDLSVPTERLPAGCALSPADSVPLERPVDRSSGTLPSKNPRVVRVAIGPIVTVVHGDGGQCFQAVGTYLKSLAR